MAHRELATQVVFGEKRAGNKIGFFDYPTLSSSYIANDPKKPTEGGRYIAWSVKKLLAKTEDGYLKRLIDESESRSRRLTPCKEGAHGIYLTADHQAIPQMLTYFKTVIDGINPLMPVFDMTGLVEADWFYMAQALNTRLRGFVRDNQAPSAQRFKKHAGGVDYINVLADLPVTFTALAYEPITGKLTCARPVVVEEVDQANARMKYKVENSYSREPFEFDLQYQIIMRRNGADVPEAGVLSEPSHDALKLPIGARNAIIYMFELLKYAIEADLIEYAYENEIEQNDEDAWKSVVDTVLRPMIMISPVIAMTVLEHDSFMRNFPNYSSLGECVGVINEWVDVWLSKLSVTVNRNGPQLVVRAPGTRGHIVQTVTVHVIASAEMLKRAYERAKTRPDFNQEGRMSRAGSMQDVRGRSAARPKKFTKRNRSMDVGGGWRMMS
jgi:hypothetical protein